MIMSTLALAAVAAFIGPALPVVRPNPNLESAGVLRNGVLSVTLEAKRSIWHFAANHPAMTVNAFAEAGKPALMPGPFIRVPAGTELRLTIRNALGTPLTFVVPAAVRGGPDRTDAMDSIIVAPGAAGTLTTRADVAGNYVYRGELPDGVSKVSHIAGMLAGAIVVDTAPAVRPPRDRVFVIMATEDSVSAVCDDSATVNPLSECPGRRFVYTINGTQWPSTDRIHATVGDSLHWRVINASAQVHPMHLHGFYYRVDALTGPFAGTETPPAPGQLVVTQLLAPLSSMSMTWSPDRPGNWLFHCHFALHNATYSLLAAADDPDMRDMVGLVLGTIVAPRPGVVAAGHPATARRLRLVAEAGTGAHAPTDGSRATPPRMHFVVEENGQRVDTHTDWSAELDLVRNEPVAITIVNQLAEPTAVHWHGMEVEDSYMDGAPMFSGEGRHLTPAIAPGDSFVARFTPPRAGTFMYHSHFDEQREELAGLDGALIVRDPGTAISPDDHVFFLKGQDRDTAHPVEIDGQSNPDTVVLHVGQPARLRLLNLSTGTNTATPAFSLTARSDSAAVITTDVLLVQWRPIAKDGFDLPQTERARLAREVVSVGETYDFEYTPTKRGLLQLEVRIPRAPGRLLIRVPIRVE
jgi:FtsP/CotA-like multicopper oxidase with cupredoxin domain